MNKCFKAVLIQVTHNQIKTLSIFLTNFPSPYPDLAFFNIRWIICNASLERMLTMFSKSRTIHRISSMLFRDNRNRSNHAPSPHFTTRPSQKLKKNTSFNTFFKYRHILSQKIAIWDFC